MTDRFFQAVNPLWYLGCDGGLLQLGILVFRPDIMPYRSLSYYGAFTKNLAYYHHTLLLWTFWIAIFLHIFEASLALRACRRLKMDGPTTLRWFLQTLSLGYVSLGILRKHEARKRSE